jgi:hypothetical protein
MTDTPSAVHTLTLAASDARALLENMRDILGPDDGDILANAIEGETKMHEALSIGIKRYFEVQTLMQGLEAAIERMKTRLNRLEAQSDNLREALLVGLQVAQMSRFEHPLATIVEAKTPAKPVYDNEAEIPSRFWRAPDPVLDKKAVAAALKAKEVVPGVHLSEPGRTLKIMPN